jgi:hypothetical protein
MRVLNLPDEPTRRAVAPLAHAEKEARRGHIADDAGGGELSVVA